MQAAYATPYTMMPPGPGMVAGGFPSGPPMYSPINPSHFNTASPLPPSSPTPLLVVDSRVALDWKSKVDAIQRLEAAQVTVKHPAMHQRLAALQREEDEAKHKLSQLQGQLVKREAELAKAYDPSLARKLFSSKKSQEKKLYKAEDTVHFMKQQQKELQQTLGGLCSQKAVLMREVESLAGQVSTLQSIKAAEVKLLQRVFDGPAGDGRENFVEAEVNAIVPRLEEVRMYKDKYTQARALIQGAEKDLVEAVKYLKKAVGEATQVAMLDHHRHVHNRNHPFDQHDHRGGAARTVHRHENRACNEGSQRMRDACDQVIKATTILPGMPKIDPRKARGINTLDFLHDSVLADVARRQKIQKCLHMAEDMLAEVKEANKWLEGWIQGRIDPDTRTLEKAFVSKQAELAAIRRDILHRAAQAAATQMPVHAAAC